MNHNSNSQLKFNSLCITAGSEPDELTGALTVPISMATTFKQTQPGVNKGFEYSRSKNPTRDRAEQCVALLENGSHAKAFASGSSATATILHLLKSGDHIISCDDVYGGTYRYFQTVLKQSSDIGTTFVDLTIPGRLKDALRENTKMIWIETPTNPLLKVIDIKMAVEFAQKYGLYTVVDNTFATPLIKFKKPLDFGVDMVMHSATKYLNGHSDVIMGFVVTNNPRLADKLGFLQNGLFLRLNCLAIGAVPSPFDCYLLLRGIKTLHLRMERQSENALEIARFLETHPGIQNVIHPGLPSHPQHSVATKQMKSYGAMVSFRVCGGKEKTFKFLKALRVFSLAESLGAVESLVNYPASMTHGSIPRERRLSLGICDSLVRLSVGAESVEDLIEDLRQALRVL